MFLPGVILFGVTAVYLQRHHREHLVPWATLLAWAVMCLIFYAETDMHRFLGYAKRRWVSMMITLCLVTAIPLAPAFLAVYAARLRRLSWPAHGLAAACFGAMAIPLTNLTSAWLYTVFRPWFGAD